MEQLPEKYTTVRDEAHVEFEEKRSLFIGHAIHVKCEEDALEFIKQMKKKYSVLICAFSRNSFTIMGISTA